MVVFVSKSGCVTLSYRTTSYTRGILCMHGLYTNSCYLSLRWCTSDRGHSLPGCIRDGRDAILAHWALRGCTTNLLFWGGITPFYVSCAKTLVLLAVLLDESMGSWVWAVGYPGAFFCAWSWYPEKTHSYTQVSVCVWASEHMCQCHICHTVPYHTHG